MNPNSHYKLCFAFIALTFLSGGLSIAQKKALHTADAPLPPEEAARTMVVPEGFNVTLFAGEPDVKQPVGFCIDDRGRLWVAEAYNYPDHTSEPGKDRIIILEDTDGDGRHDERKVFYEGLNYVTGIEVGFGGAWVMSPPFFYFIPDRDGDDVPDGKPEVLLDGFGNHANAHNLANGFAWGPDGWLYGTHGRTNWSMLGKPGTPEEERIRFDGGVYRYHPVTHQWEPYSDGTTNPWGIDWDDYGQSFVCNCVNPHLFHVIEGAHYEPWRGRQSSQHAYQRIETISDHLHYTGGNDVRGGFGTDAEDAAGGGHAHCGTMVYLGDNWPAKYRNGVFMNNIHGRRINHDVLEMKGSGYSASHASDIMRSNDPWFMGVTLAYGPDGAVFVSDWSDTGECHSYKNTRRETGRIYKISYGKPEKPDFDLTQATELELCELQMHPNDWWVRHARRMLHERAAAGNDMEKAHRLFHAFFVMRPEIDRKLRALWALKVTGGLNDAFLTAQLSHESEHIRAWAVRLLAEGREPPEDALSAFAQLAMDGESPVVRLQLASALQRLEPEQRWPIAEALASRGEDAGDQNLPMMVWYGIEPLVGEDLDRFVGLAGQAGIPLVRQNIARRAAGVENGLTSLISALGEAEVDAVRADLLGGILAGLEGRRSAPMPVNWVNHFAALQKSSDEAVRDRSMELALIFDDSTALELLRDRATAASEKAETRNRALDALIARRPDDLAPLLLRLIDEPATRRKALRGLAEYNAPKTVETLLERYGVWGAAEKQDAIQTLASRPAWANALLDAVEANTIPRAEISAFAARQIASLGDESLAKRVGEVWGDVRESSGDKKKLIARLKKKLRPEDLKDADPAAGRVLFQRTCMACHKLFDEGAAIGPEITGAQRDNLDYLLENILDPSAVLAQDYRVHMIETDGGRVVSGFVVSDSEQSLTIQSLNEQVVIPAGEIVKREELKISMMPEGLLLPLSDEELRNLIAYLQSPKQVPMGGD